MPLISKKTLNIIFGINNPYALPAFTTAQSALDNLPNDVMVHIFILHFSLSEAIQNIGTDIFSTSRSSIHFINCTRYLGKYLTEEDFICESHWTKETYLPLLIPLIFQNFDKTIFLDADLLIRHDISKVTELVSGKYKLGAVACMTRRIAMNIATHLYDECFKYDRDVLGLTDPDNHFNAGILVFNHKAITEEDAHQCLELTKKRWRSCDESVLNKVFDNHTKLMPITWNYDCSHYMRANHDYPEKYRKEWVDAKDDMIIFHYSGQQKPWLKKDLPFSEEFNQVWNRILKKIDHFAPSAIFGKSPRLG